MSHPFLYGRVGMGNVFSRLYVCIASVKQTPPSKMGISKCRQQIFPLIEFGLHKADFFLFTRDCVEPGRVFHFHFKPQWSNLNYSRAVCTRTVFATALRRQATATRLSTRAVAQQLRTDCAHRRSSAQPSNLAFSHLLTRERTTRAMPCKREVVGSVL